MFGNIGPWELTFILAIALLVIGPGKLPETGKALGKAIRGFNQAKNNVMEDLTVIKEDTVGDLSELKNNPE